MRWGNPLAFRDEVNQEAIYRAAGQELSTYLKMAQTSLIVIPAKAGIQVFRGVLDPCFHRGDGASEF